ncbi:YbaB/EbfC family nucleoid-associated protein [Prauserella cavernicola]|uniref:YbaB/EbfC family nucleoid-associated protein n=1 Tax=Prauserella cavernicola TaxID=2800127 RepID=A0A934V5S5_9PSEU|nr:YbaB/EbfC family nucleoid-associated protein [Prauserella cavernicola]MBK1786807.1 YbaB/EbfC family nucleoid-associated protein [Prauserella cavernicola]
MTEFAAQLLRRIEALDSAAADNRRRAEAYRRMEQDLKSADATATSPDGVVTVVAGPGGAITSVTFADGVREVSPQALSATVRQTIAAAVAEAARRQAEIVRQGLGSSELLDRVLESDERLFGDQRSRPIAAPVPAARRGGGTDDEDFFTDFDVFSSPEDR